MTDPVNGSGSTAPIAMPEMVRRVQDQVPEFGPTPWEMRTYQSPLDPQRLIMELAPPFESGEKSKFFSKLGMMTNKGPVELTFAIEQAATLAEAVAGWQNAARQAIAISHMQMQENSKRILVPDAAQRAALPKKIALN